MIALIAFLIVMFGILGFRIYRTVYYYREAQKSFDKEERRVIHMNFIIHLVFCIVLSLIIVAIIYWFVLASNGEV